MWLWIQRQLLGNLFLRHASHEVPALNRIRDQLESSSIGRLRLTAASAPAEQVGSSGMEQVIAVELVSEWVHEGKPGIGSIGHGNRDRSVQLDDG